MTTGSDADLTTTQWAAVVALFLVLLVPLAMALAWWFKQRYARAVVRLQAEAGARAETALTPVAPIEALTGAAVSLQLRLLPAASVAMMAPDPIAAPRRLRRRVLRVQFAFGLAYWCALLLVTMIAAFVWIELAGIYADRNSTAPMTAVSALAALTIMGTFVVVPPLLAWALQAGVRTSVVWWIVGTGGLAMAVSLAVTGQDWVSTLVMPLTLALLGLTMTAFLRPAVRGAGPPLMAAMIVGMLVFCALSFVAVLIEGDSSGEVWAHWTEVARDLALIAAALAVSAFAGWRMLLRIARRYGQKRFSEVQLAFNTYWGLLTLFTLTSIMFLSFEEKTGGLMEWAGLAIVLLWLAWRVAQRLALRWAVRRAEPARAPLLLLRVFKPSRRSEAFIDRFLARWRFAAPVWMIAGPDLAGALMEPDEFFAYLRRTLAERYVSDASQIPQRVAALDGARDPDGRCRVSELFCANTTWQPAVLALIERAGVIVLDLREYTASRAGTRFELQQLLARAPLERVLLLTDEPGDAPQLRAVIEGAWRTARRPAQQRPPELRVLQLATESDAELDGLFRLAADAAAGAAA